MNNRTEHLLDRYFSRTISDEEKAELKALLAQDPALAREFNWQIQLARHAHLAGAQHPLKQRLREEQRRLKAENNGAGGRRQRFLFLKAAAVILLVVAAWFIIEQISKPQAPVFDPEQAAMNNFQHFPNNITIIVAGHNDTDGTVPDAVRDALKLYDARQYPKAAQAFRAVVQEYPDEIGYRFYYGVSLVGAKQFSEAIPPLDRCATRESPYKVPALFYLGLANTGAGKFPEARKALNAYINDPEGRAYRKNAEALLKELPK